MRSPKYLSKIALLSLVVVFSVGMWSEVHAAAYAKTPPVNVSEDQTIVLSAFIPKSDKKQPELVGVRFFIFDDLGNTIAESNKGEPISVLEGTGVDFEFDAVQLIGPMFIIGEIEIDRKEAEDHSVSMQLINTLTRKTELIVSPGMIWGPSMIVSPSM